MQTAATTMKLFSYKPTCVGNCYVYGFNGILARGAGGIELPLPCTRTVIARTKLARLETHLDPNAPRRLEEATEATTIAKHCIIWGIEALKDDWRKVAGHGMY